VFKKHRRNTSFSDPGTPGYRESGCPFSYTDINNRAVAEYIDGCDFAKM